MSEQKWKYLGGAIVISVALFSLALERAADHLATHEGPYYSPTTEVCGGMNSCRGECSAMRSYVDLDNSDRKGDNHDY